ncbi:hypothetical protein HaLaN_16312, partial [Haematococcus lacustris]
SPAVRPARRCEQQHLQEQRATELGRGRQPVPLQHLPGGLRQPGGGGRASTPHQQRRSPAQAEVPGGVLSHGRCEPGDCPGPSPQRLPSARVLC